MVAKASVKELNSATCTVACKIPNGLTLQLYTMEDSWEPSPSGARPVKKAMKSGEPVTLNGFSRPAGGEPAPQEIIGGFGLTHGVSSKFMSDWFEQNADLDVVKNGLIFFADNRDEAAAEARDKRTISSNQGPLSEKRDGDNKYIDPRMPKQIKKVTKDEEADTVS